MSPLAIVNSQCLAVIYAVFVYFLMYALSCVLVMGGRPYELTRNVKGRVGAIDGLRGILALGVFVHHSVISYIWMTTGIWSLGPNSVLNNLGQSTVALFFMITGFLFTRKTMAAPMDWSAFYMGRLARLGPLYFLLVIVVFTIILSISDSLVETPARIFAEFLQWIAFVCFGRPDINAYPRSWIVIAGVNWSLRYEALFYLFAVPMLYWMNRGRFSRAAPQIVCLAIAGLFIYHCAIGLRGTSIAYIYFLIGIAVAHLYSYKRARTILDARPFHWFAAANALFLIFANKYEAVVCLSVIFAATVGNASIFGLLKTRAAIWLGDISYGIYLIHGLALWVAFHFIDEPMGLASFVALSPVIGATVVILASASYISLELPAMNYLKTMPKPVPDLVKYV